MVVDLIFDLTLFGGRKVMRSPSQMAYRWKGVGQWIQSLHAFYDPLTFKVCFEFLFLNCPEFNIAADWELTRQTRNTIKDLPM